MWKDSLHPDTLMREIARIQGKGVKAKLSDDGTLTMEPYFGAKASIHSKAYDMAERRREDDGRLLKKYKEDYILASRYSGYTVYGKGETWSPEKDYEIAMASLDKNALVTVMEKGIQEGVHQSPPGISRERRFLWQFLRSGG